MPVQTDKIRYAGQPVPEADRALIMLHGRGGSAGDMLSLQPYLDVNGFAILVPQAKDHSWYPVSFLNPRHQNEPWLSSALQWLQDMIRDLGKQGIGRERIYILGFSQGACLALEFAANQTARYGGIVAFAGGLVGERIREEDYHGDLRQTPVLIATSDTDPHIPLERAQISAEFLKKRNADVTFLPYIGLVHTISQEEIDRANKLIFAT